MQVYFLLFMEMLLAFYIVFKPLGWVLRGELSISTYRGSTSVRPSVRK